MKELLQAVTDGLNAMVELMDESIGVCGLHLNGDDALAHVDYRR